MREWQEVVGYTLKKLRLERLNFRRNRTYTCGAVSEASVRCAAGGSWAVGVAFQGKRGTTARLAVEGVGDHEGG